MSEMTRKKSNIGRHEQRKKAKPKTHDKKHLARTKELEAERAAEAMVQLCFGSPEVGPVSEPVTEVVQPPPPKRRKGIDESRRRHAIHELFVNLGEPDAAQWKRRGGTVSQIRDALRINKSFATHL